MPQYVIKENNIHHQFFKSRAKIQIFGGAYANGKTAAMCVKAITIAKDYPGLNALIARSTYPKLNDSTRKEFYKWIPHEWVKRWPTKDDNTMILHNGSTINFRYAKQQGGSGEHKTSNLLSNTYDLIVVDQMEDPEFSAKDLPDLLGRLRGSAEYVGDDVTMPPTGPRWILIGVNPTAGWIYKQWIREYLNYKEYGLISNKLAHMLSEYETDTVEDLIEVITGSTMDNAHNLGDDVIRTMKATYTGVMRERFLEGSWNVLDGLVYPDFNEDIHMVEPNQIHEWIASARPHIHLEAIDYGIASPACYLLAMRDKHMNNVVVDGFHEPELTIENIIERIKDIRTKWNIHPKTINDIYADPSMFKRITRNSQQAGESIRTLLWNDGRGVGLRRGNNEILSGIIKVRSYLRVRDYHVNPFTKTKGSPFIFFNRDTMQFLNDEIVDYYFAENTDGTMDDKPRGINDHAMDALKYLLTDAPTFGELIPKKEINTAYLTAWNAGEYVDTSEQRNPRYG